MKKNTSLYLAVGLVVLLAIIILIFGEITPKCLVKLNPEKAALRYSNLLFFLMKVLTPLTFLFQKLQGAFNKNKDADKTPTVTENELESIIAEYMEMER